jgi:hypothetical protein
MDNFPSPSRDPPGYVDGPPSYGNTPTEERVMNMQVNNSSLRLLPGTEDQRSYVTSSTISPFIDGRRSPKRKPVEAPKVSRVTWEDGPAQECAARGSHIPSPVSESIAEAGHELDRTRPSVLFVGCSDTLKATVTLKKNPEANRSPVNRASPPMRPSPERYHRPTASSRHVGILIKGFPQEV